MYFVSKDYRRQGLAKAAVQWAVEYSGKTLRAKNMIGKVPESNVASRIVLERQGFRIIQCYNCFRK